MLRLSSGLLLLGFFGALQPVARAQVAVYAVAGLANYGFTNLSSGTVSSKTDTGGFGAGAFYNFPIQSRVTVGIDGRFAYSPGYNGGVLAGAAIRVGFVPHHSPFRPYFQVGGGVVHSSYSETIYAPVPVGSPGLVTVTQESVTSGAAQFAAGLDIRLNEHFDVRAVELGAEAGGGNSTEAGAGFLNAGIVYHLRSRRRP